MNPPLKVSLSRLPTLILLWICLCSIKQSDKRKKEAPPVSPYRCRITWYFICYLLVCQAVKVPVKNAEIWISSNMIECQFYFCGLPLIACNQLLQFLYQLVLDLLRVNPVIVFLSESQNITAVAAEAVLLQLGKLLLVLCDPFKNCRVPIQAPLCGFIGPVFSISPHVIPLPIWWSRPPV